MDLHVLEEYVFSLGNWKSIDEMEEHLTIEELHRLFIAKQKADYEARQFAAALKGVQMDPWEDPDDDSKSDFDEIKRRADIKRRLIMQGKNPNDYGNIEAMEKEIEFDDLREVGFGFEGF